MSFDGFSNDQVNFLCHHCGTHSRSEILAEPDFIEEIEGLDGEPQPGPEYRYRLVRCSACSDISLLLAMKVGTRDHRSIYEDDFAVYPTPPRAMSSAVPKKLQTCFQEARACYRARAYTASAIMCRRSLELLTAERGIKGKNLADALEKLKAKGDIDQRLYDWCNALRLAGNQAAHDVGSDISQTDVNDMNDLAEAVIDYVYVFQARYEDFMKRRS
jgi:uncharacterized protein DUF4145